MAPVPVTPGLTAPANSAQDEFAGRSILCPWIVATSTMVFASWIIFPVCSRPLPGTHFLFYWSFLSLGLVAQLGFLLWQMRRECGSWDWRDIGRRLWICFPRDAKSGLPRPRLFGWLGLWAAPALLGAIIASALGVIGAVVFTRVFGPLIMVCYPLDLASPLLTRNRTLAMSILAAWLGLSVGVEELLFRGFLLPALRHRCGRSDWLANAALYAGYYVFQPWLIPARFVHALIVIWPVRRWRSVWMSIILRGLPDLIFFVIVFWGYRWPALPLLPSTVDLPHVSRTPSPGGNQPAALLYRPLASLPRFDPDSGNFFQVDLRSRDLSALDLQACSADLAHAEFDSLTRWPPMGRMPAGFDPTRIMELGKNPGLGLRELHRAGLTGRGVGIGIVDQYLLTTHREYGDRLRWYEEIGPPGPAQMHGPAVASLALGNTVGVAPEANLYHIGFGGDWRAVSLIYHCYALGIRRLLGINGRLYAPERIRVISLSISLMPGLPGAEEFRSAIVAARKEGVAVFLVEDEASLHIDGTLRIQGLARPCQADPDRRASYGPPRWLGRNPSAPLEFSDQLFVPMDSRTHASPTGPEDYTFDGQGGMSWTVPYVAGLYALAVQIYPELRPDQFRTAVMLSARPVPWPSHQATTRFGPMVDPKALKALIDHLATAGGSSSASTR